MSKKSSSPYFRSRPPRRGIRGVTVVRCSRGYCGFSRPEPRGETCPNPLVPGKPSTATSGTRASGVLDRILNALHLRLYQEGKIGWDLWCLDSTSVRATRFATGEKS
jgi:hypothetical protein